MSPREAVFRPISPTWPVWAALVAFAALIVVLLVVDARVARGVARQTADIVENAGRAIDLVDDLRDEVHHLSEPTLTTAESDATRRRVAQLAAEYDPLVDNPRERAEWLALKQRLREIETPGAHIDHYALRQISDAVDRLVEINRDVARADERRIKDTQRSATAIDATVGGIVLALAIAIGWWLMRVLARQRALVAEHFALLDARNRELDAFAARAAHDLRVPLNPLRGYADLLATGDEPPDEVRHMAQRIRVAVQRMARTIDDMLELARASAPANGESASVKHAVSEVLDERKSELAEADVHVVITDEQVACREGVLALILRNLVGNAIKFRARDRRLSLSLETRVVDGNVEIVVADNGVGMDADSVTHAFEPGYRGRGEREIPGHGLGLAIVERATHAVGGECSIASMPERGTTVTLRLRRAEPGRDNPPR